jgi:hypothetical protein
MDLSPTQRSVLAGTMLGDACIARHGRYHRLHVKHKGAHRALVDFKYHTFETFVSMAVHEFDQQLRGKRYPCAQFATRTDPIFSEWYDRFYEDGRKIVPSDIERDLDPLALAVWFMDDGAADYAGVTFQTHSFTLEEVEQLDAVLRERFHLASNPRQNRGGWILYVQASSLDRLRAIIEPHILPEFGYKLIPRRERLEGSGRDRTP